MMKVAPALLFPVASLLILQVDANSTLGFAGFFIMAMTGMVAAGSLLRLASKKGRVYMGSILVTGASNLFLVPVALLWSFDLTLNIDALAGVLGALSLAGYLAVAKVVEQRPLARILSWISLSVLMATVLSIPLRQIVVSADSLIAIPLLVLLPMLMGWFYHDSYSMVKRRETLHFLMWGVALPIAYWVLVISSQLSNSVQIHSIGAIAFFFPALDVMRLCRVATLEPMPHGPTASNTRSDEEASRSSTEKIRRARLRWGVFFLIESTLLLSVGVYLFNSLVVVASLLGHILGLYLLITRNKGRVN
jgi:hypothetical protein